jgi:hypothetical protein
MGKDWKDCIVTLIDLVGVKGKAQQGIGSKLMLDLHKMVIKERGKLEATAHAYVWNDSVLLLSYVNESALSFESAMKDADKLKQRVDTLDCSYAIAVKGQTFPSVSSGGTRAKRPSLTVIRASSWAMANVFEIERTLGRELKKPWYVDDWIRENIHTSQKFQKRSIPMFPKNEQRTIYVFDGYLWPDK